MNINMTAIDPQGAMKEPGMNGHMPPGHSMINGEKDRYFTGEFKTMAFLVTLFGGVAIYNALELLLLVFCTFKAFRGLYFWSILSATCGVIPFVLGTTLGYFKVFEQKRVPTVVPFFIIVLGLVLMVTGHSVVLYSRLWIVFGRGNQRILKASKWMIIVNAVICHTTSAVLLMGLHYGKMSHRYRVGYDKFEEIQMTIFALQETFLAGLYIWKTVGMIRSAGNKEMDRMMWQLLAINVVVIFLSIDLLAVEFEGHGALTDAVKGLTYSIKLKMEFAILGKIIELANANRTRLTHNVGGTTEHLTRVKSHSDASAASPPFPSNCNHESYSSGESGPPSLYRSNSTAFPKRCNETIDEIQPVHLNPREVMTRRRLEPDLYAEALKSM